MAKTRLKFLQLNIYNGKYMPSFLRFLRVQKFDIMHLQEVAGGKFSFANRDCFAALKRSLGYRGILSPNWKLRGDKHSYTGNAIFLKQTFPILATETYWLKKSAIPVKPEYKDMRRPSSPRAAPSVRTQIHGKSLTLINTHLAVGPDPQDTKYKIDQGLRLYNFVKKVEGPFVLSGDFNVWPKSKIIKKISSLAQNLSTKFSIKNTLNMRTHYARNRIPPPGNAVDYIFLSKSLRLKKFRLVSELDLSDHLPLVAEFEI